MGLRWRASIPCALLAIVMLSSTGHAASTSLVISQVYSAQDAKSRLRNDFIEIFNLGSTAVDLGGCTVQIQLLGGSSWQSVNLNGTLTPGQYFLISGASASFDIGLFPLPAANASTSLAIATAGGRLAIVRSTTALTDGCPLPEDLNVV